MDFRSSNILFDFSGIRWGRKTAGTRGALAECPGGSSGDDSRHCRVIPRGGALPLGTRGASGDNPGKLARSRAASGGILPAWGIRGHAAGSKSIWEGRFYARHSGQVALSEGKTEEGFEGVFEGGGFRRGFGT